MPSTLVIPGVQVRTEFEPAPVLPGATGVLGVVGVTDRGPLDPTPVSNFGEFIELFGPASRYTMSEVRTAFANGVAQVFVTRIEPGRGSKATLDLVDDDGEKVATLEARAEGAWANNLSVKVTQVKTLAGRGVKYVNVDVLLDGRVIESHPNLVMDHTSPDYFFNRINAQSRVLIGYDPLFQKGLPSALARTAFADADARAAFTTLRAGTTDVLRVEAKRAGDAGNKIAVQITDGQAGLALKGAGNAPSVDIRARQPGAAGITIRITVANAGPDSVNFVISAPSSAPRTVGPFNSVDALVAGMANDPDVIVQSTGTVLPAELAPTQLQRRVDVHVYAEGRDTSIYPNCATLADIAAVNDPLVTFTAVGSATQLPDANQGVALSGGRSKGRALLLVGDESDRPLLELVPATAPGASLAVTVNRAISTIDNASSVANLAVFTGDEDQPAESYSNLTMDPDDPNYLPVVLQSSGLLRAFDLFVRSRTTSFPRNMARPESLGKDTRGTSPTPDDYQSALERLERAEEVDLVIASVNNQLSSADIRTVHQAVVAHCTKMADVARNRIGIGSVSRSETNRVADMLDHANDVRSEYFILVAPTGGEAALAGLLGRQDYFQSPTFKTIVSPDMEPGQYSDAQLTQLINNNICVINEKRKLGIIVIKGLLTNGRQINVQRTANKAVREVNAISNVYIGLLNNEGTRNALRQQIFAMLLQMERDGALVPSVDGKDPAFKVDVYSTQADFANGIVRIDIAVRPVRAIDYIYATILVKN